MIYQITFSPEAEEDIIYLKSNDVQAYKKLTELLKEMQEHPYTGTGKPKPLRNDKGDFNLYPILRA